MPRKNKHQKTLGKNLEGANEYHKILNHWNEQVAVLEDSIPPESRGRVRSMHEKYLILMALKLALKVNLRGMDTLSKVKAINWTMLEAEVEPIELFWGQGKNYARSMSSATTTNREVVAHLREGWYGNEEEYDSYDDVTRPYHMKRRKPVDCERLFLHCIDLANTKYIPLCDGIDGTMDNLIIHADHVRIVDGIPLDIQMLDMVIRPRPAENEEGELHPL